MLSNKRLLSKKEFLKGMLAIPDIELLPEEADRFIDYVVDESFWKDNARIVKMAKNEKNIRYLGFKSGRFLKPADHFASSDYQKEFAQGKITLSTKKLRGAVVIYDDDLEDGIEGQAFADHLMKIVAKKVANELDEIFYVSNSGWSETDARHEFEGFRYLLFKSKTGSSGDLPEEAVLLDANSTGTGMFKIKGDIAEQSTGEPYNWEFKFSKMISSLDSKYKAAGLGNLRFFCNDIIMTDYINALSERSTVLGDSAVLGKGPMQFGQIPIMSVPQMPTTYAGSSGELGTEASTGGSYADCILTTKDNFIIGLQRELKMESKRAPEDEATYIFYSIRCDTAIENPESAVLTYNLTHG